MKAYWDSSALVLATADIQLQRPLHQERGITRTHALADTFSTLTGGNRVAPEVIQRPRSSSDRRFRKLFRGRRSLPFTPTEKLSVGPRWDAARSPLTASGRGRNLPDNSSTAGR